MDFNGDEGVDEEAAALSQRILSGMARTMTSFTLKAKLVSALARLLLLVLEQKKLTKSVCLAAC